MKNTIFVLGGSQRKTLEKIANKKGCNVIFHDAKNHGGIKKCFKSMVQKADVVVFQKAAGGHVSMNVAKDLAKKYEKLFVVNQSFGASSAIELGLIVLHKQAS